MVYDIEKKKIRYCPESESLKVSLCLCLKRHFFSTFAIQLIRFKAGIYGAWFTNPTEASIISDTTTNTSAILSSATIYGAIAIKTYIPSHLFHYCYCHFCTFVFNAQRVLLVCKFLLNFLWKSQFRRKIWITETCKQKFSFCISPLNICLAICNIGMFCW